MNLRLKEFLAISFIIILAFILRVYKLDQVPPSLYWDEAAMALDAKSVALTGKDQHGSGWLQPIYPSWGDYKLPGYIISAVPFFKIIKSNPELAIRLPSALVGVLTVLAIYFLTKELFRFHFKSSILNFTSLIASFLLAISPWHLQFSRAAFEANLALFFNIVAVLMVLKSNKNKLFLIPGAIFTIFGIYTYYSSRIVLPIILIFTLLIFLNKTISKITNIFFYLMFGLTIIIAFLPLKAGAMAKKAEQFRLSTKNVLSNPAIINYSTKLFQADGSTFWARKIHHRFLYQAKDLVSHIFDHLSVNFLVLTGDNNLRHSTTSVGVLGIVVLIGLIMGEYYLFSKSKKIFTFLNLSLLVSLIPAGATYETPHSLRSLNAIIFFNIIAAYGLVELIRFVNGRKKKFWIFSLSLLLIVQLVSYLHDYYVHYPVRSYNAWQGGYKEAVIKAEAEFNTASNIIFTDFYARPYIYFLLYSHYPLEKFQALRQEVLNKNPLAYEETTILDKIEFRKPTIADEKLEKVVIIASTSEFSDNKAEAINDTFVIWKNY